MQIDPEGRAAGGISGFLEFVVLNLLFLVTCLPVVTIGAALSALFEVTMRYSDDERGRPLPDYLPAFKRNFRQASLVMLALGLPAVVLLFSALFWVFQGSMVSVIWGAFAALAAAYLAVAFMYGEALVARYRNTTRQTLRNALLLPGAEPVRTMALALIPATVVALAVLFPPVWFLVATVGFSFGSYAAAFLLRHIFSRHA
ncbi:YesL family protein [Demequina sp.]|uniref:YesL family protein n=1 Tax=Demequina sp. TaxID=2050685 RepID=UPI003A84252D